MKFAEYGEVPQLDVCFENYPSFGKFQSLWFSFLCNGLDSSISATNQMEQVRLLE